MEARLPMKTIQDVVDKVPLESVDLFLVDFWNWLKIHKEIKKLTKDVEMNDEVFMWIDDWKNDINLTIQITNEEKKDDQ